MNASEILLDSLQLAASVFGLLILFSLITLRWRRHLEAPWRQRLAILGHYLGMRLVAAATVGTTFLIIMLAAVTLNTQRPPADTTPVVETRGTTGPVTLRLSFEGCGDPATGTVTADRSGKRQAFARVYSDDDGFQRVEFDQDGRANFTFSDPSAKRGLLSCYLPLPVISGSRGPSTVKLALSEDLTVETNASVPAPTGLFSGSWLWRCPAGVTCPAMATIEQDIEDGAKQLIVLVLASILGAIIAIFASETLVNALRTRLDRYFASRK